MNMSVKKLLRYFVCLAPFWFYIFDVVHLITASTYEGIDGSNLLVVVGTFVFGGVVACYLIVLTHYQKIRVEELCFFSAVAIMFALYMLAGIRFWGNAFWLLQAMRRSVLHSMIGVLSLYIIRRENCFDILFEVGKWLGFVGCIAITVRMMPQLASDWRGVEYFGSMRYQTMGWLCAKMAVLAAINVVTSKNSLFRLLNVSLIITTFAALFLTGARGAMVAFIIVMLFIVFASIKKYTYKALFTYTISGIVIAAVTYGIAMSIPFVQEFIEAQTRTFNFISNEGVDMQNRAYLFTTAISLIYQSPIFGYGFASSYYIFGIFVHNFLLEFMLDGGIFFAFFMVTLMAYRMYQWIMAFRSNKNMKGIFAIISVNLVLLVFSSSYYRNAWFWMFIFFTPTIVLAEDIKLSSKKESTKFYVQELIPRSSSQP